MEDLLRQIEQLRADNERLSEKKSGNHKPTTFVFFYYGGRLCTGNVERAAGKEMHIRVIYPTDSDFAKEVVRSPEELMTIIGIDEHLQKLASRVSELEDAVVSASGILNKVRGT